MPGEANRVTVQRIDVPESLAAVWTVRDEGAPVVAGPGCTSVETQTARCEAPAARFELGDASDQLRLVGAVEVLDTLVAAGGPGDDVLIADGVAAKHNAPVSSPPHTVSAGATFRGGDGTDHLVGGTRMDGGNGDDLLQGSPENDFLDGGRGADRLEGASGYDWLVGGGGRDTLLGGADSDQLEDGDRTGATDDTAPDADLLDGGAGKDDQVWYGGRRAPVTIDLAGRRSSGQADEGDTLMGIEIAFGGHRDDWLRGNDGPNRLFGLSGDDVLIGGGGRDFLVPGKGAAKVTCGRGRDLVGDSNYGTVVAHDCERVWPSGDFVSDNGFPSAYPVRRRGAALTYRIACPSVISHPSPPFAHARCRATLRLTTASKPHRVLARGRSPLGFWKGRRTMAVYLTAAGRRLANRPSGDLALTTLRLENATGRAIASARWAIRLK